MWSPDYVEILFDFIHVVQQIVASVPTDKSSVKASTGGPLQYMFKILYFEADFIFCQQTQFVQSLWFCLVKYCPLLHPIYKQIQTIQQKNFFHSKPSWHSCYIYFFIRIYRHSKILRASELRGYTMYLGYSRTRIFLHRSLYRGFSSKFHWFLLEELAKLFFFDVFEISSI